MNRLIKSSVTGTTCSSGANKVISYGATGSITKKSDICNTTSCMVYGGGGNAGPHALSSIVGTYNGVTNPAFTYDNDGNMLSGAGRTMSYMSFSQPSSIAQGTTSAGLAYDAFHQRYKMCTPSCTSPTATTYYMKDPMTGMYSERVVSGSTTTWNDYVIVPGAGIVAVRIKTGGTVLWRYAGVDHLGSVSTLTDAGTGTVVERDSYDSWGKRRNADGSDNTTCSITSQASRGFTGHEMLDSLCLINMNARLYDPSIGRFMSADSIVPNAMNTQSHNRYSYVANNPLAFTDLTGHGGGDLGDDGDDDNGYNNIIIPCTNYCGPGNPLPEGCGDAACPDGPGGDNWGWGGMGGFGSGMRGEEGAGGLGYGNESGGGGGGGIGTAVDAANSMEARNCTGTARILGGNARTIGRTGGFGVPVEDGTAAIIPEQFGTRADVNNNRGDISATLNGQPLFNGATDVIGGRSPIPGVPVRNALQQRNPGQLIIELPGGVDQGHQVVTVHVPDTMTCPAGTG